MRTRRFAILALLALSAGVRAAVTPLSPIPLHHTGWTAAQGAPPSVFALAQGADGWLWLGTVSGLYRFDGVTFERFRPPGAATIRSDLWGMRMIDGALWFGYRSGGLGVWEQGRLRTYGRADGLPPNSVADFVRDGQGRVWAATSRGMYLFDGHRWRLPEAMDPPRDGCLLLADRSRTVWAQCVSGVYALPAGAARFVRHPGPVGRGRLAQGADGTVWSSNGPQASPVALAGPGANQPPPAAWPKPRANAGAMLFERDGIHVWNTVDDGLVRSGPDASGKAFGIREGLSGTIPLSLLEDREGNIWIGTENGLDRFRPATVQGVALPQVLGDSVAIAAGDGGGLWIGGQLVPHPDRQALLALPPDIDKTPVAVTVRDGPGAILSAGADGLWRSSNGVRTGIAVAPGERVDDMFTVARDGAGDLWAGGRARGVLRLKDGKWDQPGGKPLKAYVLYPEPGSKAIWFGLPDNVVRVLRDDQLLEYGAADGIGVGNVLQFLKRPGGMLLSGTEGLCHFDGRRCFAIVGEDGDMLQGISGLVEHDGTIWANGSAGITAIRSADLQAALAAGRHRVPYRRLNYEDGLAGTPSTMFSLPSAVVGTDGKLWFTTSTGLFWLGAPPVRAKPAPPVAILRLLADGVALAQSDQGWQVPPHTARVRIEYTALNLGMPQRTRFMFRLRGAGTEWVDNRNLRATEYTDLAPGRYVFELRAANEDGSWSPVPASAAFTVQPALYQTLWFRTLCLLAVAGLLYAAYRLRVRGIAERVRERLQERFLERERIARDLHDTFLQTVYGLVLKMDNALRRMKADEPERRELESALQIARDALEQGRVKVHQLRGEQEEAQDLPGDIQAVTEVEEPGLASVRARVEGAPRRLHDGLFAELTDIGREALRNAIRHADAREIRIDVLYADDGMTLCVRDDGKGIPPAILAAGGRRGHWGLTGMRERVERLGGGFELASDGHGTSVRVTFPARLAYAETTPAS
jgi:signal transduction histidine kinase/ligand-binding sensor domain-containing protein